MKQVSPQVGVACFVWKNGKFIMNQRFGSHGAGTWSVPGGHLEMGEDWKECAAREVLEETGLQIQNIRPLAITNDIFDKQKHYVTIWLEADWLSGKAKITEPDKCIGQNWYDFKTLPSPLFEPCWKNLRNVRPELFR